MLNVPLLQQDNRPNCLPVCVDMVMRFHGRRLNGELIRRTLRTNDIGTPFFNIRLLASIDISVDYVEASGVEPLIAAIQSGVPPICAVNTLSLAYWDEPTQHALVVVEIGADHVILNDPAYADQRQQVTLNAFLLAWADHDYQYAILHPR